MNPASIPMIDLLPHGPEMTVIDRLISYDVKNSVAIAEITSRSAFFDKTGVPAWVGVEYMAQTIAAHAGFAARLRGESPAIGFLLGTRAYHCRVAEFLLGSILRIGVEPMYLKSGFGSFKCSIETDEVIASAVINTYQPKEQGADQMRDRTFPT